MLKSVSVSGLIYAVTARFAYGFVPGTGILDIGGIGFGGGSPGRRPGDG